MQQADAIIDQPAVRLQLRFAGSPQADASFLPLEMRPAADEPGRQVFELGQLDLQLAFETAGALREDIEDQAGTVDDPALELALEIALLARRQRRREYDQLGIVSGDGSTHFLELAAADKVLWVRALAGARDLGDHDCAGGSRQLRKLFAFGFVWSTARARVYEYCSFTALRTFKQPEPPPRVEGGIA